MKGEAKQPTSQPGQQRLNLLPWPKALEQGSGVLQLATACFEPESGTAISDRLAAAVSRLSAAVAQRSGLELRVDDATPLVINLEHAGDAYPDLHDDESYWLVVDDAGICIDAANDWGALRALATLLQLVSPRGEVPYVAIDDAPRFAWRGLLLDVARHFLDMDALKRTLDGMAACKLNVLHLHLSDDQAVRFPSTAFGLLASDPCYSLEDLDTLVEFAEQRGIRVVPELDMPGHVNCWLTAYPEWGIRQTAASERFGVHQACLDPSREEVYRAIDTLIGELCAVFPDQCLHLGGDEVHPAWWSGDPHIASFMRENELEDVADLQAHFNRRVGEFVKTRGRTVMAWDEVLHPRLDPDWIVQAWRGATSRDRIRARGNPAVVSAPYYLDLHYPVDVHYRADPAATQESLVALEDQLRLDPRFAHVADGMGWTERWRRDALKLTEDGSATGPILGGEACLWGELVDTEVLDVRLWSRLPALAERFWSAARCQDTDDLLGRLEFYLDEIHPLTGFDIGTRSRQQIAALGIEGVTLELTDMLEPVKWYGRLLGEVALAARIRGDEMPQARPYLASTPLTELVDYLPPESVMARQLDRLAAGADEPATAAQLRQIAERWLQTPLPAVEPFAQLQELLRSLAVLVVERLNGHLALVDALEPITEPQKDLMIAVGPGLRAWLVGER